MHLSDSDRLDTRGLPNFWDTVSRIAVILNLNHEDLADIMEMTPYRLRVLQKYNKEPTVSSAMALTKRINVGFDALVLNEFDYKLMAQQYFGNQSTLPERYLSNALSRRRTVIPHLDYIEKYFGWAARALVLRKFQLTEAMFVDPQAPINTAFTSDLIEYILGYYKSPKILEHMGWNSATRNKSQFKELGLEECDTVGEVYDRMIALGPKNLEKNYDWKLLDVVAGRAVLEGKPSEEMLSQPHADQMMTRGFCLIRSGFLSGLPSYAGLSSTTVEEVTCVAEGDSSCRFHVHIAETAH